MKITMRFKIYNNKKILCQLHCCAITTITFNIIIQRCNFLDLFQGLSSSKMTSLMHVVLVFSMPVGRKLCIQVFLCVSFANSICLNSENLLLPTKLYQRNNISTFILFEDRVSRLIQRILSAIQSWN